MDAKMTKIGREQLCKAHAGDVTLSPIKKIALGNGGCQDGSPITVTGDETALKSELIKKDVASHTYIDDVESGKLKMRYTIVLGDDELVGDKISEAGLIDENERLVAYITFLEKGKDQGMEFTFNIDEIF